MDFENMSKEELIEYIKNCGEEYSGKYGLVWDSEKVPEQVVTDCNKFIPVLQEVEEKKISNNGEDNILIEGDNFHSLSVLNYTHKESIDMIYIDPPYNTGSKDFIYNDVFVDKEDGYRHSKWLNFMSKRLKLARNLLREDGVIFISIDDNEVAQLKLLCDKIFGINNFVSLLSIENNPKGRKNSNFISISNEFCLIYAKNKLRSSFVESIPKSSADLRKDDNGNYVHNSGKRILVGEQNFNDSVKDYTSDKHYSVYYKRDSNEIKFKKEMLLNDIDTELIKNGFKRYYSYNENNFVLNTYTQKKLEELFNQEALDFKNGKIYEKNFSTTIRLKSLVVNRKYNAVVNNKIIKNYQIDVKTTSANNELKNIFGTTSCPFDNPKSIGLLKLLITLNGKKDITILDFFAGSGTTAQAVLELNKEDGGNRKFILCTNNENNICQKITYQRIKTVITGKRKDGSIYSDGLHGSLNYFKTYFVENNSTRDQIYFDLTEKCISMLRTKEVTFNLVEKNESYAIYTNKNNDNYTCIYYDIYYKNYDKFINKIKEINSKKSLYIFSLDNRVEEYELDGITNYKIEAIPQKIYDLYKKLVKLSKEV